MTSATRTRALWIVGAASLLTVTTAWAETVTVTQGAVTYQRSDAAHLSFEGAYLWFGSHDNDHTHSGLGGLWSPGTVLNVGISEVFGHRVGVGGDFLFDGHWYEVDGRGGFTITGGNIEVPHIPTPPDSSETSVGVTAPFQIVGVLYGVDPLSGAIIRVQLRGRGTVHVHFTRWAGEERLVFDWANYVFTPDPPRALLILTPNTPSRWGLNTRQRLAWTYAGDAPQFQIDISRDSGETWTVLATVANAPGDTQNFDWTVTGPLTSAAKFRVTAVGDPEATDINDTDIRIANPTIEILTPAATTAVALGSPLTIFYKHSLGAGAPVNIEVSIDNGQTWRRIAATETNGSVTASYQWNVGVLPTSRARVRVRAADGTGAAGTSRAFTVSAVIESMVISGGQISTTYVNDAIEWDIRAADALRSSGLTDRGWIPGRYLFPRCNAPCKPTPGTLYGWSGLASSLVSGALSLRGRDDLVGVAHTVRITSMLFPLPSYGATVEIPFSFEALVAVRDTGPDFPVLSLLKLTGSGIANVTNYSFVDGDFAIEDFAVELTFASP